MSPASKSKSKEKKAGKDSQKASSKPLGSANAGSGVPASAYNPLSGTFHNLETMPSVSSSPLQNNGRFRNIDETDDHSGGSHGTGVEYDSVSNNGSWSGESEDHKDKNPNPSARQEAIPGGDNDKREKIRQKNERKHQRQKERRAQELHERCSGYLMSRKLESLAQQLVAMGFSRERATMALILNEGKVEESVAWLLEGAEEPNTHRETTVGGGNLKIDISEELARISDLEIRFKCTKQEVERAVVAAEGDIQKATETLRAMKQDPPPKPEETGDPSISSNGKAVSGTGPNLAVRPQLKLNPSPATQHQRDERDFNYTKPNISVGGPLEPGNKNLQPLKRIQPKLDWAKPQQTAVPVEKRWPNAATTNTSPSSYSVTSPPQGSPSPAKTETRYMSGGNEFKSLQPSVREPVVMMQRPKSVNTKQIPATSISSSPPAASNWFPTSSVETAKTNGFMPRIPNTRNLSSNNLSSTQMYQQLHYPQQQFAQGTSHVESPGTIRGNSLWNRTGASPTLAVASSLGLFSGLGFTGTSGSSSPVDWSSGSAVAQLDYTNIDWSLDRGLTSPRPGGLPLGFTSPLKNTHLYDPSANGLGVKSAVRLSGSNSNGVSLMGLQDGGIAPGDTSGSGSREWTSPFEGNDLFTLSRQFVSSPSL